MKPLTPQQRRVLEFIRRSLEEQGYPPSVREICGEMGFRSSSTAHRYLETLEEKGYIKRTASRPRAIRILQSASPPTLQHRSVPLLGRIRAGLPLLAEENLEGYLPLPAEFTAGGEYFILRVEGESMSGAGIQSGDLVLIRKQQSLENGEIGAFLLHDEATIKRFYRDQDSVRLEPANEHFEPIFTREVKILGRVTGLYRRL